MFSGFISSYHKGGREEQPLDHHVWWGYYYYYYSVFDMTLTSFLVCFL
jgi:hypothetical protein